jgi:hypothetical protein
LYDIDAIVFHVAQNLTNETIASLGDLVLPLNTNIRKKAPMPLLPGPTGSDSP